MVVARRSGDIAQMHVLADDLTSALDALAPFATRGFRACVLLNDNDAGDGDCEIRAIDLDSRFLPPADARARFASAAARIADGAIVIKTIDSTLRGNIAAEIDGTLEGVRRRRAIVAPAFPAAGRVTVAGQQWVDGVPVDRSIFARDPRTPATISVIADLLPVTGGRTIVIRDASTDADLDTIVAAEDDPAGPVWVGSPGLAAALARRSVPEAVHQPEGFPLARRILTVIGSAHPASRGQIAALAACDIPILVAPIPGDDPADTIATLRAALDRGSACLVAPSERIDRPEALVRSIAGVVAAIRDAIDGIVVTGGETARHVLLALGAERLDLWGEVAPGVPFGVARAGDIRHPFATKAGGFGDDGILLACATRLSETRSFA